MCGFVAVLSLQPSFPRVILERMRDRLAHRGPDGKGAWLDVTPAGGTIALGHRRLSIIDLSAAAAQPLFYANGRYAIVFNGEIYNYIELREELHSLGMRFRTESDTEVLLAAFCHWGERFLEKLNGMFALVIWDRASGQLFVARDRFGEKPLYLARLPCGGVAFASEAKALFAYSAISADIDMEAVSDFANGGALISGERTLFKNVDRFPPASAATFNAKGRELLRWRYWTPDYTKINFDISPKDAAEEFGVRLRKSLKLRLRSDVQVGACLSGGLDSSTLVGMLANLESEKGQILKHTYSARFDSDPTMSEGPFIDMVLSHTGVGCHSISPDAEGFVSEARQLYWHQEIPFLSPSIYLEWCVLRLARQTGSTVMIDGQGADELLGGYAQFFRLRQLDLANSLRFKTAMQETQKFSRRLVAASEKYADSGRRFDKNVAFTLSDLALTVARGGLGRIRQSLRSSPPLQSRERRPGIPQHAGMFRKNLASSLLYDSLPMQLHSADRSAMAHGVETRFPFLDYELVDWTISLPDEALIGEGWQKLILRRAAVGTIPDKVTWRADKVGYAAPQDRWIQGGMRNWTEQGALSHHLDSLPGYDRKSVQELFAKHIDRTSNNSWQLFRWATTAEWLTIAARGEWRNGVSTVKDTAPEAHICAPT